MKRPLLLLALLFSLNAHAIPETDYDRSFGTTVMPYFNTMMRGEFRNQQGLDIHWRGMIRPNATKTLVIFPGRTEASIKYAELVYDLQSENLNVFILDHQGQGESGRLFRNADKCHVKRFSHYIEDAERFMKKVVLPNSKNTERVLLGHSMGGLIATHYVKRNPKHFAKVVLSAPMFQIKTPKITEWKSYLLAKSMWLLGKGSQYIPYGGRYKPERDVFENNFTTSSELRFNTNKAVWLNEPRLQVGDPTISWTMHSILWGRYVPSFAQKIKTPIMIIRAGNDRVVSGGRMERFCSKAPHCKLVEIKDAGHGILDERDIYRDQAISHMKDFLAI